MESYGYAAIAIAAVLLGAGSFIAYTYYNVRIQSPVTIAPTVATINLFVSTPQSFPVNTSSLVVFFSGVDIHSVSNNSWIKLFTTQTSADLVKVGNVSQSIGSFQIPPGGYDSLRVGVGQSYVIISGAKTPLTVPASAQSGLITPFPSQFNLPAGSTGGVTMSISVDRSALALKSMNLTISASLVLGIGITTGTSLSTSFASSTSASASSSSDQTKTCYWPFC